MYETSLGEQMRERLRLLLTELAIQRTDPDKPFMLSGGELSLVYCNLRAASLHSRASRMLGWMLWEQLQSPECAGLAAVAGVWFGGAPLAIHTSLSAPMSTPLHTLIVGAEGDQVEGLGNIAAGSRIAVVEDTTSSAKSLIRAVEVAWGAGLDVVAVLAAVNRGGGEARDRVRRETGLNLKVLFDLTSEGELVDPQT